MDTTNTDSGENKKMEIEITRYKGIVKTFNTPTALAKLIVVVSLIIILVFLGVSIIALVVKSYYPYKTVNSNEYGATIIENEDNEIIYWLFNTADLWANTGIKVKKGDVISVRASGAFHSSIHHLVDDARANKMTRKWLNPMGGQNMPEPRPREDSRAEYRISSAHPFNTLLMQVIPEDIDLKEPNDEWNLENACYLDGRPDEANSCHPDIYAIGTERDKVTIRSDGELHFAVNDIALTKEIIMKMREKVSIGEKDGRIKDTGRLEVGEFPMLNRVEMIKLYKALKDMGYDASKEPCKSYVNDLKNKIQNNIDYSNDTCCYCMLCNTIEENLKSTWSNGINYGAKRSENHNLIDKVLKLDEDIRIKNTSFLKENYTELDYYLISNFVDAWFVDNVGSYLIVIERKRQ